MADPLTVSLTHDPPLFEQELLKLAAVHADAALANADRRQLATLYQFVSPGPGQIEKFRRLRHAQPFSVFLCVHNPPGLYRCFHKRYDRNRSVDVSTLTVHLQRLQAFDLEGEQ